MLASVGGVGGVDGGRRPRFFAFGILEGFRASHGRAGLIDARLLCLG